MIGPILQDTGASDDLVHEVCNEIANLHTSKPNSASASSSSLSLNSTPVKMLEAPIKMKDMSISGGNSGQGIDWTTPVSRASSVDQERLEKAEKRAKQKLDKRKNDEESAAEVEKVVSQEDQTVLSAGSSMKLDSKSKDIRVLNFDLALPGLKILQNATLTLGFCGRYGLIGRNGIGKTTLMKSIAAKKISIPSHVTVLFVEQEVMGDDTTVLQSVLDADTERREVHFPI